MQTMTGSDFIKAFPIFGRVKDGLARELLSIGVQRRIPAQERLYSEGDGCSGIALVISGEIRVFKTGRTGREITLYEIGPGETCILNASCILSGSSYPADAVASTDTEILLLPADSFKSLVDEHREMRDFIFRLLSNRLAGVMELVEEVAFGRMDERLWDYIIEKSEDNRLAATHQKIANDLGTSREVVSRLLKDLERRGSIAMSRNEITILSVT